MFVTKCNMTVVSVQVSVHIKLQLASFFLKVNKITQNELWLVVKTKLRHFQTVRCKSFVNYLFCVHLLWHISVSG